MIDLIKKMQKISCNSGFQGLYLSNISLNTGFLMNKQKLREIKLLELLKSRGRLNVATVTAELKISEATACRFFAKLEKESKLLRIHGGVQAAPELSNDYSFRLSVAQNLKQKEAIGKAAAAIVKSGSHLFMDAGTTVLKMAEALSLRLQTGEIKNITGLIADKNIAKSQIKVFDKLGLKLLKYLVVSNKRLR